jgi:CPA2 family monovalent cation:H+ antiporter-2
MPEGAFFRDLALLLIAGGLLITALAGPRISGTATFHLFAEFGVVLLMFALGVEFSLCELWKVRALALIGAPGASG